MRGDWMEVLVTQPDPTCRSGSPAVTEQRGWVKWRDRRGPWIYIHTRGC